MGIYGYIMDIWVYNGYTYVYIYVYFKSRLLTSAGPISIGLSSLLQRKNRSHVAVACWDAIEENCWLLTFPQLWPLSVK